MIVLVEDDGLVSAEAALLVLAGAFVPAIVEDDVPEEVSAVGMEVDVEEELEACVSLTGIVSREMNMQKRRM